jgi:hypothetical protein
MIKDPAYYRDLLLALLNEDEDDDIPNPPSRTDIKMMQKQRDWMSRYPTEADKIARISQHPHEYDLVINPSEAVKVAGLRNMIRRLQNPSE